jgi:integrase
LRPSQEFLKRVDYVHKKASDTFTHLSLQRWAGLFESRPFNGQDIVGLNKDPSDGPRGFGSHMLFLRMDQALELLRACRTLRERLIVRYFVFNGLSPMELSEARVENLDPLSCTLFLPRRHWKRNCLADIDPETVRLQVMYSVDREKGPLIRAQQGGHLTDNWLWHIVKDIALRTSIPGKEAISPLILKRTFAREWLLAGGCLGTLQKQFSHKHLWSTAHYLRFVMEDVKPDHARILAKARGEEPT